MDDNQLKLAKQGIKTAAIVVCGIASIIIIKRITTRIKNAMNSNSLKKIADVSNATITTAQANVIAQGFYSAMADMGTDEDAIKNLASQLKNAADWAMVINAFGYKDYGTYGSPLYSWMPSSSTNLMGWLRNEVSGSLLQQLESTWAQYGIVG